jgi:hypothetical protein
MIDSEIKKYIIPEKSSAAEKLRILATTNGKPNKAIFSAVVSSPYAVAIWSTLITSHLFAQDKVRKAIKPKQRVRKLRPILTLQ